jgi:enoyl-CoA hydratase/carnithine racemase
MTTLQDYAAKYRNAHVERSADGVLHVTLHDGAGAPLLWCESAHRELAFLYRDIAEDLENRVVLLSGTGGKFIDFIEPGAFGFDPNPPSAGVEGLYREGRTALLALLDINVPVVAAISGAIYPHGEIALFSDIVVAASDTEISDRHFVRGLVPGDGAHTLWTMLLGANRGRYLLLTGKGITAQQALDWGLVAEVVEPGQEIDRARELASEIAKQHPYVLRATREAITIEIRRRLRDELSLGLALEGLFNGFGNAGYSSR